MNLKEIESFIDTIPDDVLKTMKFAMPWQYSDLTAATGVKDEDGFYISGAVNGVEFDFKRLQAACKDKFDKNPFVSTSIRGLVGRMVGMGFETVSDVFEIQQYIEQIELDPRNRLYY